jgi:hypothetical protein
MLPLVIVFAIFFSFKICPSIFYLCSQLRIVSPILSLAITYQFFHLPAEPLSPAAQVVVKHSQL